MNTRPGTQQIDRQMGRRSFDKKLLAESEESSEKISYFG